jgi:hypothetical protein
MLVQIDAAKQQWGLIQAAPFLLKPEEISKNWDPSKNPDQQTPTEEDLKKYLGGKFPVHPPGGRYIINSLGKPPESTTYGTTHQMDREVMSR